MPTDPSPGSPDEQHTPRHDPLQHDTAPDDTAPDDTALNDTAPRETAEQAPAPRRRTRFRRRGDYLAVTLIVLLVATLGTMVWQHSDIRATVSRTTDGSQLPPAPAFAVPERLRELWRAPSGASSHPVTAATDVITADGGTVLGRNPRTGAERWRYSRDLPLCTVERAFSRVLAVYRRTSTLLPSSERYHGGNCSEVTALEAGTGKRREQRNGNAEADTRLLVADAYASTTGRRLIDTWRSDLVLTSEYGDVPDPRNPNRQPHPNCVHGSVAAGGEQVGVVEHCPGEDRDRLTVYAADNPDGGDDDRPSVRYSVLLPGRGRIVAMTDKAVAVALPDPARLLVYAADTSSLPRSIPLDVPDADVTGDPARGAVSLTPGVSELYWYTGSATVALSTSDLHPMWTKRDTLGPATDFGGETLVPVAGGLAVADARTGVVRRTLPVDRGGYRGKVSVGELGEVVLEQRGRTLVALG